MDGRLVFFWIDVWNSLLTSRYWHIVVVDISCSHMLISSHFLPWNDWWIGNVSILVKHLFNFFDQVRIAISFLVSITSNAIEISFEYRIFHLTWSSFEWRLMVIISLHFTHASIPWSILTMSLFLRPSSIQVALLLHSFNIIF